MIPAKQFYMIRHGQTEANARQVMAGSLDSPLTETGRQQAYTVQAVVRQLEVRPERIYHSHLSRARDTASIINKALDIEMIEDPDLAEMCAGEWEGAPWEDCRPMLDTWVQAPGGEHPDAFFTRIRRGKKRALEAADSPALIVCHGGVMRGFGALYGVHTPGIFKNCHLYEFQPDENNSTFPWKVWSYELDDGLVRTATDIYHAAADEEIA